MKKFEFFKFSPSGNTTLFLLGSCADAVARSAFCQNAIGPLGIPAEQAAFADICKNTVEMAAGEFCANACCAFGALLDLLATSRPHGNERRYQMRITGNSSPIELYVSGSAPLWRVRASFACGNVNLLCDQNANLVSLPGISHLLRETSVFPALDEAPDEAARLRRQYDMERLPASGIVWWRKAGRNYEIFPWVHVPAAGTSMLESSCGSASLALALSLHKAGQASFFKIGQPGGEYLETGIDDNGNASLRGNVSLCASGSIWLDQSGNAKPL